MSGLALLAPHLTRDNAAGLLARAAGKSKREIEVLVRELAPLPDVATSIRKVPARAPLGAPAARPLGAPAQTVLSSGHRTEADCAAPAPGRETSPESAALPAPQSGPSGAARTRAAERRPRSPTRYHVSFTASEALKLNLDKARELAGHSATVESLFEDAMELLVAKLEQKRFGVRARTRALADSGRLVRKAQRDPRTRRAADQVKSRYIPKSIRREVYERDGGQCTYVDETGRRCRERCGLELDHAESHALGGDISVDNLRLRCGPHNRLHAEQCFGPLFVAQRVTALSPRAAPIEAERSS